MLSARLLSRTNLPQYGATVQRLHTSTFLHDSSSSSSDSDKKGSKKKLKSKPVQSEEQKLQSRSETTNRLNNLLDQMMKEPKVSVPLDLSIPPKEQKQKLVPKKEPYEETVITAAKQVAATLGGDVQKTESELLSKLLSTEQSKSVEPQKEKAPITPLSLSELIAGMKIDRTQKSTVTSQAMPSHTMQRSARAQAVAKQFESSSPTKFQRRAPEPRRSHEIPEPGNLYIGTCLNIFDESQQSSEPSDVPKLTTWEKLEEKEFKLALIHPPENIFQEMILWTEQGKLWKFPIDNEQGLEEEQSVHFSEHVFVERYLRDWCPKRGPIRHFMELVCVGLSKNPYMTVNEKKEHIAWYREYFGNKQELLKDIGAIEGEIPLPSKQIEA